MSSWLKKLAAKSPAKPADPPVPDEKGGQMFANMMTKKGNSPSVEPRLHDSNGMEDTRSENLPATKTKGAMISRKTSPSSKPEKASSRASSLSDGSEGMSAPSRMQELD